MKLPNMKEEILGTMYEAMKEAIYDRMHNACATVETNDGYIDLMVTEKGDVDAIVAHDDLTLQRKQSNNLIAFCENALRELKWADVKHDVECENAETPEQEYARRGEAMFSRSMQWHRF